MCRRISVAAVSPSPSLIALAIRAWTLFSTTLR
jgi:hypothetical protein